ncbi:polyribonucleotide nucleotidyltransferase [Tumebacillus sp. ITR2]|uniref:Polyribonucleotide nucleotidyltransferase n=2 Tax=Tumebacillus amylolyticus TaxID=2801339 RepID=A0ABS1JH39_9BACL|nr:polyribonucleotide nucleotidyltransferase [Tumebacillus amylolyticus]MBL0388963.1 polyribonucleotide nucleotidyltransferase [Tumebacillus amylolyticus]
MHKVFTTTLGGRTLSIEIGKVAKQASGSCLVRYGDTVVLSTVTASKEPKDLDFFPLTVNYEERLYSVGKIPGGFIKREGRPSEKAILASRLIDRPIRPLFPDGFRNDIQVMDIVMSVDQDCAPEIVAMIGTSVSLMTSNVPFEGPIAGVIIGRIDGELIVNPTVEQAALSDMHLVVAGTKHAINMVEAGAKEVTEADMIEAIMFGHDRIKELVEFQEQIVAELQPEKMEVVLRAVDAEINEKVRALATDKLKEAIRTFDKHEREQNISSVKDEVKAAMLEELGEEAFGTHAKDIGEVLYDIVKEQVRYAIVHEGVRPDGRKIDEVRPISTEVGILPRVHGSGLFTRGQTQVLSVCTLGVLGDAQEIDGIGLEEEKRFMHHYNFPPFSVGEARPLRAPSRRDIGHGALGERAMEPVIPDKEEFPYTIRLVSEVLESNGSSSQASICGSILAMMDAGVPIKAPVSGVAMGLIADGDKMAVLTDIQGMEDHLGDMDFKVAGTEKGITALQMDIKIKGINREVLETAMEQAHRGRAHILAKMMEALAQPREDLSPYAPRIITLRINPDKIRDVIGPGGRVINKIIDETGVKIDIEQDGRVFIAATNGEAGAKAKAIIEGIVKEVEAGVTYNGKVTRVEKYGAFVEVLPGKEGLVHISQLGEERVANTEDVVKVGDMLLVKCTEIDPQGRVNLSHKEALRELKGLPPSPPSETRPPRRENREGDRGPRGGGDRGGDRRPYNGDRPRQETKQ